MTKSYSIHWFRRDLRVAGNPALEALWKKYEGRVVGVFCFDSTFLSRADFSHNRFAFFLKTLKALKDELNTIGSDLLVVDCLPQKFFPKLFSDLKNRKMSLPETVSWNRDYEPFARKRDEEVEDVLNNAGITPLHFRDHLIVEPWEITKGDENGFYQIYTPFSKRWMELLSYPDFAHRIESQKKAIRYLEQKKQEKIFNLKWENLVGKNFVFSDSLDDFEKKNLKNVTIPIPNAGSFAAFKNLEEFSKKITRYADNRDFPSLEGTSRLSHFFKNGSITTSLILFYLSSFAGSTLSLNPSPLEGEGNILRKEGLRERVSGAKVDLQFVKEIIWREFYYSILWNRPDVEHQSFLEKFRDIKWENNEKYFKAWCEGKTGFPIVDAGMRELNTTGLMHNRVRMIVGSFLTKDLLIDWKWGENYFMKYLLDGDLAANNGGWQWAASTGCDPQPYFRIFNPWLQSAKFDPDGIYIKKFVPELKNVPSAHLHHPDSLGDIAGYPKPIVNHALQREKALKMYQR